uniref:Interleukin n=1 Tax=Monopterus albus TaxID=43700 RepID=A0A3Q3R321_MONAL|nr:interleukin-15 isoform X2 [Monopterus albus]
MMRGGPALTSVYLCFVCLLALKPQPAANPCSRDIRRNLNSYIEKAPELKWLNCSLYTPTTADYQKCPISTLKCFADEIEVLTKEWDIVGENKFYRFGLNRKLKQIFNKTETGCLQCERLKEKDAKHFLEELQTILQFIFNKYCSKRAS